MTTLIDAATVAVGDSFDMVVADDLLRAQIVQYAGASGDFHPFHVDEPHARQHGFDGVFAHGMHTMGLTGRIVSALAGDDAVRNYTAEMRRQVWPGDRLTATATVTTVTETTPDPPTGETTVTVDIVTRNQDDDVVLTGSARVLLRRDSPRR